ncbi:MAG: cysteine--tRNA ligase [Thermoplasmata archaeon]|nr:MAG: cysteine--tRNA ligase [Thermoplasmata archaeon]
MTLKVYNTRTGKKELFEPFKEGLVRMYVCGPTVYDMAHVGHARSYVAFDVIRRYLEHLGYRVLYIQNFTDVDDKIIARAKELGSTTEEVAERYIREFLKDMRSLRVKPATIYPRATDHIADMIRVIEGLIEKGHAYVVDGNVYFDVESARDKFGQLTHQSLDEMMDGARVEIDPRKKNPKDFALWKAAKEGEPSWDSPWGPGRPGWHIECSTMSTKYLGEQFDIHGGGRDLIFPHHEAEILQSECYTGKSPMVKYWLHNGFVTINKEKMSKSLGNYFTIREILKKYPPMVLRFFLIYTHYRSPIDFSWDQLQEASSAYGRLKNLSSTLKIAVNNGGDGSVDQEFLKELSNIESEFYAAMDDDFNTRVAMAQIFVLDSLVKRYMERGVSKRGWKRARAFFNTAMRIFGLSFPKGRASTGRERELIELLLQIREEMRRERRYEAADRIRDRLRELGIVVEDTKEGPVWRLA